MYEPKRMSVEELARGFRELGVQLYGEELTARRKAGFKKQWRERLRRERRRP